jgi:ketosteroid isomerase-like protein
MVGAKAFARAEAVGPSAAGQAAEELIKDFAFEEVERLAAVIDADRAATVNKLRVSFQGGAAVTTEVCDVWEFDSAGKVTSLKQFVDTDLVRRMMDVGS